MIYDPYNGGTWYIGEGFSDHLDHNFMRPIRTLQSRLSKIDEGDVEEVKRLKQSISSYWSKLRHCRDKFHRTVALFYAKMFHLVLRPSFGVAEMTRRASRISSRVSRKLRSLSFYAFSVHLKREAANHGLQIETVSEAYTSKVCYICCPTSSLLLFVSSITTKRFKKKKL